MIVFRYKSAADAKKMIHKLKKMEHEISEVIDCLENHGYEDDEYEDDDEFEEDRRDNVHYKSRYKKMKL